MPKKKRNQIVIHIDIHVINVTIEVVLTGVNMDVRTVIELTQKEKKLVIKTLKRRYNAMVEWNLTGERTDEITTIEKIIDKLEKN